MTTTHNGADTIEHEIGRDGELIVRLHTGDITIRATEGTTARVHDDEGHDLEDGFQIERSPGRLSLRPRDRISLDIGFFRRGRAGGRLVIDLPATASISVDTANADIHADGLRGEQRYRTASGEVELLHVSGPLGVDSVSGDVRIEANGAVDLSGRIVSGDLRLDGGSLRSVALGTTSGDVTLGTPLDGPGPYSIQTVSGDVRVVGGSRGLRVDGKTLTGDISSDAAGVSSPGRGRREFVVGSGESVLTFKSISGDLRVASFAPGSGDAVSQVSSGRPALLDVPAPPEPPEPPAAPATPFPAASLDLGPATAPAPDPRLEILRELEAGTIDIDTATRRLAAIEDPVDG